MLGLHSFSLGRFFNAGTTLNDLEPSKEPREEGADPWSLMGPKPGCNYSALIQGATVTSQPAILNNAQLAWKPGSRLEHVGLVRDSRCISMDCQLQPQT